MDSDSKLNCPSCFDKVPAAFSQNRIESLERNLWISPNSFMAVVLQHDDVIRSMFEHKLNLVEFLEVNSVFLVFGEFMGSHKHTTTIKPLDNQFSLEIQRQISD